MGFSESSSDSVCIDEILDDYHDYYIHKRKKRERKWLEKGQELERTNIWQIFFKCIVKNEEVLEYNFQSATY